MRIMKVIEFCNISTIDQLRQLDLPNLDKIHWPFLAGLPTQFKKSRKPIQDVVDNFPGNDFTERLYNAIYNNTTTGTCEVCSKSTKFYSAFEGYTRHCSYFCAANNPKTLFIRKQTNLELFGVENTGQSKELQSKHKSTMMSRYGVANPLQLQIAKDKRAETQKLFGEEISKKTKETNLVRHGHISNLHSKDGKNKVKSSLLERYGVEHNSQIPGVKEKKSKQLHSYRRVSEYEEDVYQAIVNLGYEVKIVRSTRSIITPYEIDIYFPDIKVGIECCGSYWHSQPWKPVDYHSMKTDLAEQKGITLIHLFDSEWLLHKEDVLAKLRMYIEQNFNSITEEKVQIDRRWPRYDLSDTHRLIKVSEPRRWYFKDGLDWMEEPKEKLKCREIYDCGVSYWNSKVGSG